VESGRRGEEFSGIDIYQAVIDEGITTFEEFKTCNNSKGRGRNTILIREPNVEIGTGD
jgi:hypothetical protein